MFSSISIIIVTAVLFLSVIVSLAVKGKTYNKAIQAVIIISGFMGVALYGYGFSITCDGNPILAIIKSLMALISMYLGGNSFQAICDTPLMQHTSVQVLFWLAHFGAVYAFAGTVIVNLGASVLSQLRILMSRRGKLAVIYGINDRSISLGKKLCERKNTSLIFIGSATASETESIRSLGSILYANDDDLTPTAGVLKKIGLRPDREVTLLCLHDSKTLNILFADAFMSAMEEIGCAPHKTRLIIAGFEEELGGHFQALADEKYGFGNVLVYDEHMMTARQMVCQNLPAKTLRFDAACRAEEDFEALIVGFGQSGKAALHYLLLNGVFEGSEFKADIFADDSDSVSGSFMNRSPDIESQFRVRFHNANAQSREFYEFLRGHYRSLKYIVLCCGNTGNEELSHEIAKFLRYNGRQLPIYCLTKDEFTVIRYWEMLPVNWKLCDSDALISNRTDKLAMAYNHYYCRGNGKSMLENWFACDSFSRESSRAAADFMPSILHIAGLSEKEVLENGLHLSDEQELNLAKTEHLRWCSFHLNNGFLPMSKEQFIERCERYRQEKAAGKAQHIRIAKDMERRTHACLTDWDNLKALSEYESSVTGQSVDYRQEDVNNLRVIAPALELAQE